MVKAIPKWVRNVVCVAIVVFCSWVYVRANIIRTIPTLASPSDFSAYFHSAQEILHGRSPYNDPALFYPPLLPFLMVPLALLNYVAARWVWFILSNLFLIGAGGLLWRSMGGGRVALCCIACVWALGGAVFETVRQGQLSPLLVLLLVIAYTNVDRPGGASAGLAFALKYFPGIVMLPLLAGRRWRALGAALIAAVAGVGLPWLVIWKYSAGAKAPVSAGYWMGTPSMFSWSVPSVVLRVLMPIRRGAPFPADWEFGNVAATLRLGHPLQWISVGTACVVFVLALAAILVACRGHLSTRQIPWAMAGLMALSLAIAPVSWTHYQVMQYPGVAMLLIVALRCRYWWFAIATATCFALVYQLPQHFLISYRSTYDAWTTASPPTLYFWTSVSPFSSLGIFALAVILIRRTRGRIVE